MGAAVQIPVFMSVDEFMAWEPGDGRPWQLVDGVPQAMAPTNHTHGALQARLGYFLTAHFERTSSPCSVVANPGVIPRVQAGHNVRILDLGVTCTSYTEEEQTLPNPVILVEVLSPSNQPETWSNVWTYTTMPSVQEILVLRSVRIGAELLRRRPDGTWPERPEAVGADDRLVLESIGFSVALADVYRTTRLAKDGAMPRQS